MKDEQPRADTEPNPVARELMEDETMDDTMLCPECGWSEDERYSHNPDPRIDSRGGFTPVAGNNGGLTDG